MRRALCPRGRPSTPCRGVGTLRACAWVNDERGRVADAIAHHNTDAVAHVRTHTIANTLADACSDAQPNAHPDASTDGRAYAIAHAVAHAGTIIEPHFCTGAIPNALADYLREKGKSCPRAGARRAEAVARCANVTSPSELWKRLLLRSGQDCAQR